MNYQDIGVADRAAWRWKLKPLAATVLGLRYKNPSSHLSGAYEDRVSRVASFAREGLKAPSNKVDILSFPVVAPEKPADPRALLLLHTGLWQWMPMERYQELAAGFVEWIKAQGFTRIFAKAHPQISSGVLAAMLPEHEVLEHQGGIEQMASMIPAATVAGTCCTALATLKLMRPDLTCVDYGANFYCEHGYHGDASVLRLLRAVGVIPVDHHDRDVGYAGGDGA
jgi:hypothetical protein